jgi:cytochrome c-type biogenesis protein CcmH
MIWVYIAALALLAVAPLGFYAWGGGRLRSRQYAAIALHRGQLAELDRDLEEGRLLTEEHAAAQLEVQRRLLADAALTETVGRPAGTPALVITAILVPAAALVLYLQIGHPDFPPKGVPDQSEPSSQTPGMTPAQLAQAAKDDALLAQLRARLAMMDPKNDNTLAGYMLLGNAEMSRGHLPQAVAAWKMFLAQRFDPKLAVETAEISSEVAGRITPEALALFKRALKEAPKDTPKDAPWRTMAEQRIAEAGG